MAAIAAIPDEKTTVAAALFHFGKGGFIGGPRRIVEPPIDVGHACRIADEMKRRRKRRSWKEWLSRRRHG